jgi:hypothetical protein
MAVRDENGISELRDAVRELHGAVSEVSNKRTTEMPPLALPAGAEWNFSTYDRYISQRFSDLSLQLRERYEAQQTGLAAALAAAEKAVNAALIAAEKAVDKAEGAQLLRNEAQNEFRKSLGDLSSLMWTIKEGTAAIDSIRREWNVSHEALTGRVTSLEGSISNLMGRIWGISAIWAVIVLAASIGVRFIH